MCGSEGQVPREAMKGMLSRARNSMQREREPFNTGPYRPKIASPGRKSRGNGENVPPDGPLNVRHLPRIKFLRTCFKFYFGYQLEPSLSEDSVNGVLQSWL